MANTPKTVFEFDLGDLGGVVKISSSQELRDWATKEWVAWQWLNTSGVAQVSNLAQQHQNLNASLHNLANNWNSVANQPASVEQAIKNIEKQFSDFYRNRRILNSASAEARFIFALKEKAGPSVAAGAYVGLVGAPVQLMPSPPMDLIDGFFEAFLYKRNIEWSATAQQGVFNNLRQQYSDNLTAQDSRFTELEAKNATINESFQRTLHERSAALDKLHQEQTTEFQKLVKANEDKLKSIEQTYDQKLALQKPVEYWQIEETKHNRLAKWFGVTASVFMVVLAGILGAGVYWMLSKVGPNENPKHWQIGILIIAAFFAIWLMRVLVRLFLSHLHLAADAAERRTMILTYLSMSREGAQFGPEDKTLIVQHLFRSASDGLVKDDAAPPTLLELFTRR